MFDFVGLTFCLDTKGRLDERILKWFLQNVGVESIIEAAKKLYEIVSPNWGYIRNDFYERSTGQMLDDEGRIIGYEAPRGDARRASQGLFWANCFGPEYVKMFGRERLLAAPAYHIARLPDEGMILFLGKSPFEASTEEYQIRRQELRSYLGEDAFNGNRLPAFRMGLGRKIRDARPLVETRGNREDIFWHSGQ